MRKAPKVITKDIKSYSPNFSYSPQEYRPNIGIAVLNKKGEVWVGSRINAKKLFLEFPWQMPQGGVKKNEILFEAALRELYEETGIQNVKPLAVLTTWIKYDIPPPISSSKKFSGQQQLWYSFLFCGDENEINLNNHKTSKPEFDEWKWIDSSEITKIAVPFKSKVYKIVSDSLITTSLKMI